MSPQFKTCLPFVGGIIERVNQKGETELLIQTRWKPDRDPVYSGTLEFPAGLLEKPHEDLYQVLAQEIKEETGLTLKAIKNDSRTKVYRPRANDASFGFRPFCCAQQLKDGKPWVGFIFLCEVEDGEPVTQTDETKNIRWIKKDELKRIFEQTPKKIFTLELGAWDYYFSSGKK